MITSSLTAAQLATLKSFVSGTPALLALWQAGTPEPIAAALSDPTNATYAGTVTLTSTDRATLMTAMRPALLSLPNATSAIQSKWDRVASWIQANEVIALDAAAVGLFSSAVTDGVLTQAQATACYQRTGSWAEVNFGAGTALAWTDVVAAMNG